MFQNNRYVTSGVMSEIEESTQLAMWTLIDRMNIGRDYLQVFSLSCVNVNGMYMQQIFHQQEQPPFQEVFITPAYYPVLLDVFVIDDGVQSTMQLTCEYYRQNKGFSTKVVLSIVHNCYIIIISNRARLLHIRAKRQS